MMDRFAMRLLQFCRRPLFRQAESRRPESRRPEFRLPVRRSAATTLTAVLAIASAPAAHADSPSPSAALSLKPIQADAKFDVVPADQVDQCRVVDIDSAGENGWKVIGPDGATLRRFVDTNNDKRIDLWCYYRYGVEAYRDIDSDFNGKADQYRWLGNAGTRWGLDRDEDGRIEAWKRISAEEVSAEVVAALRDADSARFAALLASPNELRQIGLGDAKVDELEAKAARAAQDFADVAATQKAVAEDAQWLQFAAPTPGLVPAGTDGSTEDVMVYENVVAMYENDGQSGQLLIGTLVKVDQSWKLVGLPIVGNQDGELTESSGVFFTAGRVTPVAADTSGEQLQQLVSKLESIDKQLQAADGSETAKLHQARADLVEQLIANSGNPEDRATWARQLIDTVSVAVQSGQYPGGLQRLKQAAGKYAADDPALAAYADFQAIQAEYVLRQQDPDADFEKIQTWYLDALSDFVDAHPRTVQSAQAMLQLALSKEFEDKEKEALAYYRKVRDGFKGTEVAEKAAGAVNRLESVGRRIELKGTTIDGKTFQLSQLRGRPVVIHYWATWCEPCKQDMKLLARLAARYRRAGLTLVGINVDARRQDAETFLRENRLPWTQLFEEGGLESSRLAKAFGVQTLPTMMLIDKTGTVVRHNLRAAELDGELEQLTQ
jgi:thiol-disulfide isomerase/thioredoxin